MLDLDFLSAITESIDNNKNVTSIPVDLASFLPNISLFPWGYSVNFPPFPLIPLE